MQLTNQQIIALSEAIAFLDGQQLVTIAEGKPVSVWRSYKIASGARFTLAQDQGKLQAAIADFNRVRDSLIHHYADGANSISQDHPKFGEFANELANLKNTTIVEIILGKITIEQLKLEENEAAGHEFPISILTALQPIIAEPTPLMLLSQRQNAESNHQPSATQCPTPITPWKS